jgi:hypothetical protein
MDIDFLQKNTAKTRPFRLVLFVILTNLTFQDLNAQCALINISALQNLQHATPDVKEAKILADGFDLRQSITSNGVTSKIYAKCWVTTIRGTTYFDQKVIWNTTQNTIKFATLNESQFQSLRKEIDERHPSGIGAVMVTGKMFVYYFGVENMDGADYWTLMLRTR